MALDEHGTHAVFAAFGTCPASHDEHVPEDASTLSAPQDWHAVRAAFGTRPAPHDEQIPLVPALSVPQLTQVVFCEPEPGIVPYAHVWQAP